MAAHFPLILTFSLGEKEQPLAASINFRSYQAEDCRGFMQKLGAFLPLPKGAATAAMAGEGKQVTK
ncbi:MAG TPA: hypothetical protein VK742_19685 [Candidatus Sulfotelmatobacter sp.]|jgi:hypothetical protein|nr:hypothetical protein [Candidatus Sulfotelmatobacter sp.]